jgi:hypothetical protein
MCHITANSAALLTNLFYLFISGGFFGELTPVAGGEYTPHSYIGSYFSLVLNIRDRTTNMYKMHILKYLYNWKWGNVLLTEGMGKLKIT